MSLAITLALFVGPCDIMMHHEGVFPGDVYLFETTSSSRTSENCLVDQKEQMPKRTFVSQCGFNSHLRGLLFSYSDSSGVASGPRICEPMSMFTSSKSYALIISLIIATNIHL